MSVIFSHALNAIKHNPELAAQTNTKATLISKTADNTKSILTRIKKTAKFTSLPKEIIIHKSENNIMKVSRKLIKKSKPSIILRSQASNNHNVWAHDLYEGPAPNLNYEYYRVFIRNLPDLVDSDILKKNINEKFREFVMGIKVIINHLML